ncbi:MAG: DsrE family protein [Gammaproteobacteria bacterium]|nr:DsrE family protein [Gammaproteobacteria bacterium]
MKIKALGIIGLLAISAVLIAPSFASDKEEVAAILKLDAAPEGVVFEIIARSDGLSWAIPRISQHSEALREKFPGLPIAVVSHGNEQFALQTKFQQRNAKVHKQVQSLTQSDIPLHVCGTFAGWRGVSEEEFPDYVDVAAEGPAQVRAYEELGYILVVLDEP